VAPYGKCRASGGKPTGIARDFLQDAPIAEVKFRRAGTQGIAKPRRAAQD
jgi:hypothetical protein